MDLELTDTEVAAIYSLARTWAEWQVVDKIIAQASSQEAQGEIGKCANRGSTGESDDPG
jgi:hypothetical protein